MWNFNYPVRTGIACFPLAIVIYIRMVNRIKEV